MIRRQTFCSLSFKRFLLILCGVYLFMVLIFHSRLQVDRSDNSETEPKQRPDAETMRMRKEEEHLNDTVEGLKKYVKNYFAVKKLAREVAHLEKTVNKVKGEMIVKTSPDPGDYPGDLNLGKDCMRGSEQVTLNKFRELERGVYVYSAYLDDRKKLRYVRLIMLVAKDRRFKFTLSCSYGDGTETLGKPYEMCENHNKQYGGYIYSCPVQNTTICPFKVKTMTGRKYVSIPVVPVAMVTEPYKYGMCIPPLFGKIRRENLVEFLELSQLLGAEQFYFYNFSIQSETAEILKFYQDKNLVTVIPWHLPKEVSDRSIWYHGQLLAHNDCMYRAMSTMHHMAINDIDEFIIPHTAGSKTWGDFVPKQVKDKHCGLSFSSAFFDPSNGIPHPTGLVSMGYTVRSDQFSHVRTKVMVIPRRVFEVGIHHISKQNEEKWTPLKVHPDVAFLHHYRKCVANYGMKCSATVEDKTVYKYFDKLQENYDESMTVLETILVNYSTTARPRLPLPIPKKFISSKRKT